MHSAMDSPGGPLLGGPLKVWQSIQILYSEQCRCYIRIMTVLRLWSDWHVGIPPRVVIWIKYFAQSLSLTESGWGVGMRLLVL